MSQITQLDGDAHTICVPQDTIKATAKYESSSHWGIELPLDCQQYLFEWNIVVYLGGIFSLMFFSRHGYLKDTCVKLGRF